MGATVGDVTAEEVLGNIEATSWAVEFLSAAAQVTVEGLLELHRRLLAGTRHAEHAGQIRAVQNWIGGSSFNPCSAVFVPAPPEHVRALLEVPIRSHTRADWLSARFLKSKPKARPS